MITVATAVCVLFAGWLDRTDAEHLEPRTTRYDRVMGLVPLAAVAALFVWALAAPASLVHVFAGVSINSGIASTVRTATTYALVLSAGAAAIVWLRPRLSTTTWLRLAAVFVAVDIGLMALTSQLTTFPPNDLVTGTTPVQQLMAAHLAPGGRMVNYDPQTYDSWPDSPQGVPDLNIIAELAVRVGLRVDRERQLRSRHPHARAGRPRPGPARLGDARSAGPAGSRDRAGVLPRAAGLPAAHGRRHHPGDGEHRHRPRPAQGLWRRLQRHRLSLLPRAAARSPRRAVHVLVLR